MPLAIGKTSWLVRSSSMWSYNFENDNYSVPIGLGAGYVVKKGKTISFFALSALTSLSP